MSYYKKITDYKLTHHSNKRIRERMKIEHLEDHKIYELIEDLIKHATLEFVFPNGDRKMTNHQHHIQFVITKDNVIKTVINLKGKN
ncbi:hypothetical protein [Malacoplasma iowae]|uniref:DUF4258 domain-containing protein n=1 Tax=Malacoplasma iowae 695 TaxID=1048830 RepID=A0A6P1LFE6_MALIO|nr:hypothetical protein [Malacoplasma iowae]QHG90178.2 hypothetical protein EER00_04820 [Malacoplasma iowae 695]WPL36073.1 hypothetical protein QX180_01480 [Malacoplasma iowae]WPL36469.1 hypothetical protein QX179_03480 [Malacoplasma iowae]WPL38367.1 hypothetical protein QX182_02535 [Malacoplasma iowae]WPL40341.1 hypothetical protein QX183_02200 [Malacoplasma iowae]